MKKNSIQNFKLTFSQNNNNSFSSNNSNSNENLGIKLSKREMEEVFLLYFLVNVK